uniref:Dynamin N-terminal domain-containing protein n=1 Tax=Chromera velia CCMP2878 TaxID=1169474 RepID=A0A0G4G0Q9_9ALVE|eukprot:Cvel_529.t1-p1 / transcript=Cvel_529.t1 / gene=Cvel_529 / organism=Chromera_velia_CCMP2878 / gene_product=Dynamin-like protein A, putative / transcript_product=Dynamin-like protein A, putative / location=Cvel_scaffold16:138400-144683(+) / protein_length=1115 / sequence_SO=supercontig / SO=protein_coding / is_pseudo=false
MSASRESPSTGGDRLSSHTDVGGLPNLKSLQNLYTCFVECAELLDPSLSDAIPRINIVGIQSAGKTSLIEYFTKFPVGFTNQRTGTRCPVLYKMQRDENVPAERPEISLKLPGEQEFSLVGDTLVELLCDHMQSLERSSIKFSAEEVHVQIRSSEVHDAVFIDLPGLIPNPPESRRDEARQVKELVAGFVRRPANVFVCVLKCTEQPETITDLQSIREIFESPHIAGAPAPISDWADRTTLIVNKFDQQCRNLKTAPDANDFFENARRAGDQRYFFVTLQPHSTWHRDSATIAEQVERLSSIQEAEAGLHDAWKETLAERHLWDEGNDLMLGMQQAGKAVVNLWLQPFIDRFPEMLAVLQSRKSSLKEKEARLERTIVESDPKRLRGLCANFVQDFKDHVLLLQTLSPAPSVPRAVGRHHLYTVKDCGRTFGDDLKSASRMRHSQTFGWEQYIDLERLQSSDHLGGSGQRLGEDLKRRMLGESAHRRARDVFKYMLFANGPSTFDDDEIYNVGRIAENGTDNFQTEKVAIRLARCSLAKAGAGIDWLCHLILEICVAQVSNVFAYLLNSKGPYTPLRPLGQFFNLVRDCYRAVVARQLEDLKRSFRMHLQMSEAYIPHDIITQDLLSLTLAARADTLARPQADRDKLEQRGVDRGDSAGAAGGGGGSGGPRPGSGGPATNGATGPPGPSLSAAASAAGASLVPEVKKQGRYLQEERKSDPEPERWKQKAHAIGELVGFMDSWAQRRTFNVADFIEGGFVTLRPQESAAVDFHYLRRVADMYYRAVMSKQCFFFDCFMQTHFRESISKDANGALHVALRRLVRGEEEERERQLLHKEKENGTAGLHGAGGGEEMAAAWSDPSSAQAPPPPSLPVPLTALSFSPTADLFPAESLPELVLRDHHLFAGGVGAVARQRMESELKKVRDELRVLEALDGKVSAVTAGLPGLFHLLSANSSSSSHHQSMHPYGGLEAAAAAAVGDEWQFGYEAGAMGMGRRERGREDQKARGGRGSARGMMGGFPSGFPGRGGVTATGATETPEVVSEFEFDGVEEGGGGDLGHGGARGHGSRASVGRFSSHRGSSGGGLSGHPRTLRFNGNAGGRNPPTAASTGAGGHFL